MEAVRSGDGKYRVAWPRSLWITSFTRPTAADTGERLEMETRAAAVLGAVGGVATSTTVMLAVLVWLHAFDRQYLLQIALVTLLSLSSIVCGISVAVSRWVTFIRSRPDS